MSHKEQLAYIKSLKDKFPEFFKDKKVLEVGSLDVNGSIRPFFENCGYLGVDVGPGKAVDLVCRGEDIDYPDNFFDTVLSCECFEHNPNYKETLLNMIRMLKPEGLLVFTCATTGRKEHGTINSSPDSNPLEKTNYYKNLIREDFEEFMDFADIFDKYRFSVNDHAADLQFFGFKKRSAFKEERTKEIMEKYKLYPNKARFRKERDTVLEIPRFLGLIGIYLRKISPRLYKIIKGNKKSSKL